MDIVIIGTGNTATVLGRKLKIAGHRIVQVFGRDTKEASALAYELNTESTNYWNVVYRNADLYILAVSDIAIEEVFRELHLSKETVVHTAASVSMNILKEKAEHFGVFYPLQSLKKEIRHLPDIPIIIDASDNETLKMLELLAHTISDKVVEASDETRVKLHLAAVLVNNFTNHLFALVEKYCKEEGLDFNLLLPLIKETSARLDEISPSKTQTGPATRADKKTIEKHLQLLQNYPQLFKIYGLFTESILQSK
ncbi:MAG: DUF2520 domain-containing protein [Bacteroidota bacterium]|nr:DUF2520 domain-containing protein [Bacteroidota bacterium]